MPFFLKAASAITKEFLKPTSDNMNRFSKKADNLTDTIASVLQKSLRISILASERLCLRTGGFLDPLNQLDLGLKNTSSFQKKEAKL